MDPNDRPKTKRRNKRPLAKFVVITIIVLIALISVFYIIDNPKIFNRIKGFFTGNNSPEDEEVIPEIDIIEEEDLQQQTQEPVENDQKEGLWERITSIIRPEIEEVSDTSYPTQLTLNLYFMGLGEDTGLVPEEVTVIAGDPKTAVINTTRELLEGPEKSYHIPIIPGGTELLSVEIYENLAKLDLNQAFMENSLDSNIFDRQIIYSIVNTLTEIPSIKGVIFYIEGKRIKVYGNVDLSIPAIRDESLIKVPESGEEKADID